MPSNRKTAPVSVIASISARLRPDDVSVAPRLCSPQAGTKERPQTQTKDCPLMKSSNDLSHTFAGRGLREDEKKWKIGLPSACKYW
jgi:hypothetical protein